MDRVTLDRIQTAHPCLIEELGKIYAEICTALKGRAICRFTHVLRTNAEQDALYAIGRTKPGKIVTNARSGDSYHNYGLAVDICLIIDGKVASWDMRTDFDADGIADWMEAVKVFKAYGWEWGGDWKRFPDAPHFQKTFGKSIAELKRGNVKIC